MAQIVRVKPGPVTAQDGTYPELRGGRKAGLMSQDVGGRYEEASYRQAIFSTVFAAAALATATASTLGAYTLWNPINSGKILSLLEIEWVLTTFTAVATGTGVCLASVNNGGILPTANSAGGAIASTQVNSGAKSVALTFASGTIVGTPVNFKMVGGIYAMSTTVSGNSNLGYREEIAGAVTIPPGSWVTLTGLGGTPADWTIQPSFMWEEISL